jgi:hypothetical protein
MSTNKQPDTLKLWRTVEKTDPQYTKGFSRGGGFRGTATNATYLAMKATEQFGPMGTGWGVEVLSEQYVEGAWLDERTRETVHKVLVKLWYVLDGKRGEVQQFGQTTFIGKNKNGCFTDEEHAKKSLTDGMSKCLSLLGFAADIHLGRFDDNKYVADLQQEFAEKQVRSALEQAKEEHAATIDTIKNALAVDNLSRAAEAWFELDKETMKTLWVAPSNGGPFTTREREIMKTKEFRESFYGPEKQAANG